MISVKEDTLVFEGKVSDIKELGEIIEKYYEPGIKLSEVIKKERR